MALPAAGNNTRRIKKVLGSIFNLLIYKVLPSKSANGDYKIYN